MTRQRLQALAFSAAVFGWAQAAVSDPGDGDLVRGDIWRHCEHYYLTVQRYQVEDDDFAIKDVSLEFIRTIRRFQPRTRDEAVLYSECVNLANGNATQAHDIILREEAEDDEFFDLALNDATNNSNASQFEYMQDIDGKYQLARDMDLARETFQSALAAESAQSLANVTQVFGYDIQLSFGTGGGYLQYFPRYGYSTSSASSWSGGGSATNNASGATLAPVTPSAQPGASSSSPAQVAAVPAQPPVGAAPERAGHLDDSCADYRISDDDATMAVIENRCANPITFHWCWLPKGKSTCTPNLVSNIIAPQESDLVPGPTEDEEAIAEYVVCDMSNLQRVCMR